MKQKTKSASRSREGNNQSPSRDQSTNPILNQINSWEESLIESLKSTSRRQKKELSSLEKDLKSYTQSVLNTTKKDIDKIAAWRIYLPIFGILLLLTLGMIAGSAATLAMQNYTIAKKHPSHPDLILCQKSGDLEGQTVCRPQ